MTEKKYPEDKPSKHSTVRIPKAMADAVDEFIKTELAKSMGFTYKIDVITAATRELLEKYNFYKLPSPNPVSPPVDPQEKEKSPSK